MDIDERLKEVEKDIASLKVSVNEHLYPQIESHRRWFQDAYEMLLGITGQKLPDIPKEPPWVQKREESGIEFQKK